jgi:hypothetical protein
MATLLVIAKSLRAETVSALDVEVANPHPPKAAVIASAPGVAQHAHGPRGATAAPGRIQLAFGVEMAGL